MHEMNHIGGGCMGTLFTFCQHLIDWLVGLVNVKAVIGQCGSGSTDPVLEIVERRISINIADLLPTPYRMTDSCGSGHGITEAVFC